MQERALFPVGLAARTIGVSENWVRTLSDRGIEHIRDASGRRLIRAAEVDRLRRERERKHQARETEAQR